VLVQRSFVCFHHFGSRTDAVISSSATYGVIPPEHWNQPDDIDEVRASGARARLAMEHVDYGGSVSYVIDPVSYLKLNFVRYRNMCRFNSGVISNFSASIEGLTACQFFFKHELLQPYRYYWRIEYV
jgi:alpha 1,2-mannosyltransferase